MRDTGSRPEMTCFFVFQLEIEQKKARFVLKRGFW
jgi:hypothetical protein